VKKKRSPGKILLFMPSMANARGCQINRDVKWKIGKNRSFLGEGPEGKQLGRLGWGRSSIKSRTLQREFQKKKGLDMKVAKNLKENVHVMASQKF